MEKLREECGVEREDWRVSVEKRADEKMKEELNKIKENLDLRREDEIKVILFLIKN